MDKPASPAMGEMSKSVDSVVKKSFPSEVENQGSMADVTDKREDQDGPVQVIGFWVSFFIAGFIFSIWCWFPFFSSVFHLFDCCQVGFIVFSIIMSVFFIIVFVRCLISQGSHPNRRCSNAGYGTDGQQ